MQDGNVAQPANLGRKILNGTFGAVGATVLLLLAFILAGVMLFASGSAAGTASSTGDQLLMDSYDMYMTNEISDALDGVLQIDKVYWLNDSYVIAPKPNPECYGRTSDPSSLQWLLDEAAPLIDGQELLFSLDVELYPDTEVVYYLDETIFCISWRILMDQDMYTFSEVFIAHPSQFRRYLADDTYGSSKRYYGSDMAKAVNAVSASNGDFYQFRNDGIVVYKGEVHRANANADICFVDDQGDLIFARRGQLKDQKAAEAFVEEHNVRFSIAFGPILVENHKAADIGAYPLGNIDGYYPRAAIGTLGKLHYLQVVAGYTPDPRPTPNIWQFAKKMESFGCEKAYALDGGQTGLIVVGGEVQNYLSYGSERVVSDIIYFATAVPDGG